MQPCATASSNSRLPTKPGASIVSRSIWRSQALYNAQSQLLNSSALYESSLDQFKVQYGLPPNLPLLVADPMLDRFNLLDPDLTKVQTQVSDVLDVLRGGEDDTLPAANRPVDLVLPAVVPQGPAKDQPTPRDLTTLLADSNQLKAESQQRLAVVHEDFARLDEALPQRRAGLERLAAREDAQVLSLDEDLLNPSRFNERVQAMRDDLANLEVRMQRVWARLDDLSSNKSLSPAELKSQLTRAMTSLSGELLELSLIQARARLDTLTFEPIDLSPEEAYCVASRYRRDWMNARASLVDSWRLIFFNANDLESDLNLIFSGDLSNVGDNPFRLRSSDARLRVGLEFDAPLTRLAERNVYRQSLIEYQQARRDYYGFCDRVYRDLRGTLRQLDVDELNFELRRAAVNTAITQVDLARLKLSEPARPVATSTPGQVVNPGGESQLGDTVARDLVNALVDLLNVQNDFLSVWVDHEVQRLQLDFDLGVMELDSRGLRIEHDQPLRTYLECLPASTPCELPDACGQLHAKGLDEIPLELQQPANSMSPKIERLPTPTPDAILETLPTGAPPEEPDTD